MHIYTSERNPRSQVVPASWGPSARPLPAAQHFCSQDHLCAHLPGGCGWTSDLVQASWPVWTSLALPTLRCNGSTFLPASALLVTGSGGAHPTTSSYVFKCPASLHSLHEERALTHFSNASANPRSSTLHRWVLSQRRMEEPRRVHLGREWGINDTAVPAEF